jgi:ribulose-5-phosphate 4-epimerase/fuculose-1-phosphate aldolase
MDEGYIKFNCEWVKSKPLSFDQLRVINEWRYKMFVHDLVGVYDNGIGYGNLSIRFGNSGFIITGSATGEIEQLTEQHYTLVTEFSLEKNSLVCKGPIKASSESLSHAVIYDCSPKTNSVIHIHHLAMWNKYIYKIPTTSKNIAFGTPEMANEIKRLFIETDVSSKKIFVMGGHPEGIIAFGKSPDEAGEILLNFLRKIEEVD